MALSATDLADLSDGVTRVLAAEWDRRALHAFVDGDAGRGAALWGQARDLGWLAAGLPGALGGLGGGAPALYALHLELGRRLVPGPFIATTVASQWLAGWASDGAAIARRLCDGGANAAIVADPDAAPGLELRDGLLHGHQAGMLGQADAAIAIVRAHAAQGAADGGHPCWTAIALDGTTARLHSTPTWDRTRSLAVLECNGAKPLLQLAPGQESEAHDGFCTALRLSLIADSIGGAEAILAQTLAYMKERIQFGKPIASFQALKHRAADLKLALERARHLGEQALDAATAGRADAPMWAGLAKAGATEVFTRIAADCIQLHGGVGFTWDYDAHLYLKRARLNEALGGANPQLRDAAAARLSQVLLSGRSAMEMEMEMPR